MLFSFWRKWVFSPPYQLLMLSSWEFPSCPSSPIFSWPVWTLTKKFYKGQIRYLSVSSCPLWYFVIRSWFWIVHLTTYCLWIWWTFHFFLGGVCVCDLLYQKNTLFYKRDGQTMAYRSNLAKLLFFKSSLIRIQTYSFIFVLSGCFYTIITGVCVFICNRGHMAQWNI